jgi:hypothetical protein
MSLNLPWVSPNISNKRDFVLTSGDLSYGCVSSFRMESEPGMSLNRPSICFKFGCQVG